MSEATQAENPRDHRLVLLHIVNDIDEVRDLIEAAWMAADSLSEEEERPLLALLNITKRQLTAARDRLDVARGAQLQREERAEPRAEPEPEPVEGLSAEERDDFAGFQSLYRDWLAARATCVDPASDIQMKACARKLDAAELALLAMPAPVPDGVWMKWEVLDRLVGDEAESGQLTNNRVLVALAAVKADVLRFGLKYPE